MERRLRSAAVAGLLVIMAGALGSCSKRFDIEFSGFGPNIRLEFRDHDFFRSFRLATCLKELTVNELVGPELEEQLVWKISASGTCVTLTGIDVGHVPDGFVEAANRLPLKFGSRHQAAARAVKDYPDEGNSSRWFVCRTTPEEADYKNDYELAAMSKSCYK